MDSVSSPELAGIFERTSDYVNLKGATSAWKIESRMRYGIDKCKTIVKIERAADRPRKSRIKKFGYYAEQLDKLLEHDFPVRVIFEARRYSGGIIAQTLLYGRKEAKRRIWAQRMAQRRAKEELKLAYPRVGVRYQPERFQRRPMHRRFFAWRPR